MIDYDTCINAMNELLRSLVFAFINFALIPRIPPLSDPTDHKVLRREILWTAGLSRLMVASISCDSGVNEHRTAMETKG